MFEFLRMLGVCTEQPSAAQLGRQPKLSPNSPSREFQLIACHVLPSTTRNSNLVDTNFGGRNKARNSGCVFFTNQTTPISRSRWSKNRRLFCYTYAGFECYFSRFTFSSEKYNKPVWYYLTQNFGIFWQFLGQNKAVLFTNQTTPISRSRRSKNRQLFCYTCAEFECVREI